MHVFGLQPMFLIRFHGSSICATVADLQDAHDQANELQTFSRTPHFHAGRPDVFL
jgi:hypothetical protein